MSITRTTSSERQGAVLVVDDIPANRTLLRETLEPKGYEVLLAGNGETALKIAKRAFPDVILLDVNMPGIDGFETCRLLKEDALTRDLPVIFITANDGAESIVEAFRAGGVDYVTKPFKAEEVLMRLQTHLNVHRLTRALVQKNHELTELNDSLRAEIRRRQQAEQSLSLIEQQQTERFHVGGTLRHDAPSYVERRADHELLSGLLRREFCYVLTSRQMGKSSLMVRTANRLRQQNHRVVTLDLTAMGQNVTPEQWYDGLISRLGWQLHLEDEAERFQVRRERLSPVQRFFSALREMVLEKFPEPLVVMVDEVDMVRSLPFPTDEFFAGIRESYNHRSEDAELNRLTFCLLGVATPTELIRDARTTPFNISKRIELEDFNRDEVRPLASGLGRDPGAAAELMDRIYYWTNGHPYLTQKLCKALVNRTDVQTVEAFDDLCSELLLTPKAADQDDNLIFVRERLLRSMVNVRELLERYLKIRQGETVLADEPNPTLDVLKLAGIVRCAQGCLQIRNRVYERVFDQRWIERVLSHEPKDAAQAAPSPPPSPPMGARESDGCASSADESGDSRDPLYPIGGEG